MSESQYVDNLNVRITLRKFTSTENEDDDDDDNAKHDDDVDRSINRGAEFSRVWEYVRRNCHHQPSWRHAAEVLLLYVIEFSHTSRRETVGIMSEKKKAHYPANTLHSVRIKNSLKRNIISLVSKLVD